MPDQSEPRQNDGDLVPDFLLPLQAEYRERLAGQTAQFAHWWTRANKGDGEARDSLRDAVHRIAGNAATLGYPRLSVVARDAELAIRREPLREEAAEAIESLIAMMRSVAGE